MSKLITLGAVLLSVTTGEVNFAKTYIWESQEGPLKRVLAENPLYEDEDEEAEYGEEEDEYLWENDEKIRKIFQLFHNLQRPFTDQLKPGGFNDDMKEAVKDKEEAKWITENENSPDVVLARPEVEADTPAPSPLNFRHGWASVEESVIRATREGK
ncbi:unnamed protein product [Cylicocyclus nassatus]|uniref:Uncharacterized protein n=1 Tax=Cylicocyclus nassatus TaxID=53992 RepID=A0AA36M663_CYLNA|nr:unnamed protein product [Cylicocyclus nassatus]